MSETTETAEADPLAGFAALMGKAGQEAQPVSDAGEAPYGWTRDEATGEMRPKKSPGRPRKSPSLEDLKAQREAREQSDTSTLADRAPAAPKGKERRRGRPVREPAPAPPVPQHLRMEGSIAKGINRLYRKAGKLAIAMGVEPEGRALVEITRADDDDDVTVGDAWEQLCRSNPRIKAFWVRMLAGGAWSAVVMAHLPVVVAFLMRDGVRQRVPFGRLAGAFADQSEGAEEAPSAGTPFAGMSEADLMQMASMAQQVFGQAQARAANGPVRGDGLAGS